MTIPGKIAIMGGGSWATALAKLVLNNADSILWYMRRDDRIADFKQTGHNPVYLSDIAFDTSRIYFSSDINEIAQAADTLVLVTPSPYMKEHLKKLTTDISGKFVVTAIKGIVPDENMLVTEYLHEFYHVPESQLAVIGGPCHAEEVALERLSYLTVGCTEVERAHALANTLNSAKTENHRVDRRARYRILGCAQKRLRHCRRHLPRHEERRQLPGHAVSNALNEMDRFLRVASPCERNISDSVYLGDLLVTAYSRFSRNHNFGSMIGRGYSVNAAKMEMEMIAEGYFGTKCMYEINERYHVNMPILHCVYDYTVQEGAAPPRHRTNL